MNSNLFPPEKCLFFFLSPIKMLIFWFTTKIFLAMTYHEWWKSLTPPSCCCLSALMTFGCISLTGAVGINTAPKPSPPSPPDFSACKLKFYFLNKTFLRAPLLSLWRVTMLLSVLLSVITIGTQNVNHCITCSSLLHLFIDSTSIYFANALYFLTLNNGTTKTKY